MTTAALIVAAGRGTRASEGTSGPPKQYAPLAHWTVLSEAVAPFASHPAIGPIQIVIRDVDRSLYAAATEEFCSRLAPPVVGGDTRQESVRLGLRALKIEEPERVLIHDAARPFVAPAVISRVIEALAEHAGAIAAEPMTDTLKIAAVDRTIARTVERTGLWRAQTPQGFRFAAILAAHEAARAEGRSDFTDDAALAEWAGLDVALVASSSRNIKLTSADDLAMAQRLMAQSSIQFEPRVGTGFDVHSFGPGDHVWLCGVRIAHDRGLIGHSDADAALHAVTDALLGALGEGDIGQHFPPSDPKWKGAPSRLFVEDASRRVAARGGRITNVDVTLLCEAPRIGPHRDAMREALATILGIDRARVGVKATTTEGLGFTGRREGLAALASATVLLPI